MEVEKMATIEETTVVDMVIRKRRCVRELLEVEPMLRVRPPQIQIGVPYAGVGSFGVSTPRTETKASDPRYPS